MKAGGRHVAGIVHMVMAKCAKIMPLCCAIAFALTTPVFAQLTPGREEAERLDAAHEEAEARAGVLRKDHEQVRADIAAIQQQLIALAANRAAQQNALGNTEEKLSALAFQESVILQKLVEERADLMDLLAALERAGMSQPPALAITPDDAAAAARAALLLSEAAPTLKTRADALAQTLQELAVIRADIKDEKSRILAQGAALEESSKTLESYLEKRRVLEQSLGNDAREAARQAEIFALRASSLRELIDQLEAAARQFSPRRKPPRNRQPGPVEAPSPRQKPNPNSVAPLEQFIAPTGRFADSRGLLRLPVNGQVLYAFGQATDTLRQSGLVVRAGKRAQVTAPFDGQILYSGLFRNFGRLLILDVGGGYHIVIAGLERSFVVADQLVLAGEPVGELANRSRPPPELYLEFQKSGRSIDPAPWLSKDKGGG